MNACSTNYLASLGLVVEVITCDLGEDYILKKFLYKTKFKRQR